MSCMVAGKQKIQSSGRKEKLKKSHSRKKKCMDMNYI